MKERYAPELSPGEIVIRLKGKYDNLDFANLLSEVLGYGLASAEKFEGYIVKTEKGKENKAVKDFLKNRKFIENAYRRDLKFERWDDIFNKLKEEINNLEEISEMPDTSDRKMRSELEKFIQGTRIAKKKI